MVGAVPCLDIHTHSERLICAEMTNSQKREQCAEMVGGNLDLKILFVKNKMGADGTNRTKSFKKRLREEQR